MSEASTRQVELLGEPIAYTLRRSAEATEPRIDVDIDGVTVVLPECGDDDPETLLKENAAWVLDKTRKYDAYREDIPDRRFEEGATFLYLGEEHEVIVESRPTSEVTDGALRLAEHHVEQTSVKRALEALYRRKARETFEERTDYYAAEIGVDYEQIEVRNQRTKWGSCSTTGTLGLNWRLMMAPPDVLDYVVLHEVAHLREQTHSEAFWDLIAEHDPQYDKNAEWLEEHSARLVFDNEDI